MPVTRDQQAKPPAKKAKGENGVATKAPATPAAADAAPESCTVFVGNLSWNSEEGSITEHFKDCGNVTSVRVGEWRARACGWRCTCVL